jgi:tetratricopeptide (TPR) repeat protein
MSIGELTEELKKFPPGSAVYYIIRGGLHLRNQSYQEAVNDYSAAIKLEPDNLSSYLNRGMTYAFMGDDEKAINDSTIYIDNHYKALGTIGIDLLSAYYLCGTLYYKQKKFIESFEDLNALLGISPDYFAAYLGRIQIYLNYFIYPDDSLGDIDKCFSVMPKNTSVYIIANIYSFRADAYFMIR